MQGLKSYKLGGIFKIFEFEFSLQIIYNIDKSVDFYVGINNEEKFTFAEYVQ